MADRAARIMIIHPAGKVNMKNFEL